MDAFFCRLGVRIFLVRAGLAVLGCGLLIVWSIGRFLGVRGGLGCREWGIGNGFGFRGIRAIVWSFGVLSAGLCFIISIFRSGTTRARPIVVSYCIFILLI